MTDSFRHDKLARERCEVKLTGTVIAPHVHGTAAGRTTNQESLSTIRAVSAVLVDAPLDVVHFILAKRLAFRVRPLQDSRTNQEAVHKY